MLGERRVHTFLNGLRLNAAEHQTAVRQLAELQKQILSLYILLAANAGALAYTHLDLAPAYLTIWTPCTLVLLCAVRSVHWWRLQPLQQTERQAVQRLRQTTALTIVLSIGFVWWALSLDPYGGPFEKGHVAFFISITVIACIFCLTHLPVAAFCTTAIVTGAFLVHCLASGNHVFVAIALNATFVSVVMVRILANNFLAFVQLIESQEEAQRLAAENARLAHTDSLTELPNRRYFFQSLDALIESCARTDTSFALAILDLDRFKPINDTYGHCLGDRVLTETGLRLRGFESDTVTVARLGGDEFGLLIRSPDSAESATAFCERVCATLQAPIRLDDIQVSTGCSGGLALFPVAGRSANELFDRADYALYHSKQHDRGTATLFSQEHEDAIRAERAVEAALRGGDLATEMVLHYQPIVDAVTKEVAQVEALARWTSPTLGRVAPDRFIPAAERSGLIQSVTILLFRKALADASRLPPHVGLSFNLSSLDLTSSETVLAIVAAARTSGIDPKRITLELTETAVMRDFEQAIDAISTLRRFGMKIALDDFGTGYSSLSYVHRLPLDKIKIDRSFMADVVSDLGCNVVSTILGLSQSLGVDCVAEGVETPEQLDAVLAQGCRYVQGYLLGRPAPIDALLDQLPVLDASRGERLRA